jgi:hypothetical protein
MRINKQSLQLTLLVAVGPPIIYTPANRYDCTDPEFVISKELSISFGGGQALIIAGAADQEDFYTWPCCSIEDVKKFLPEALDYCETVLLKPVRTTTEKRS